MYLSLVILLFVILFLILFLNWNNFNKNTIIIDNKQILTSVQQKPAKKCQNEFMPSLMLFTMKGCCYCIEMLPVFKQVARQLCNKNIKIMVLDADKNSNLVIKHKIGGFPTLLLCLNNIYDECIIYDGERTVEDILRFVNDYLDEQPTIRNVGC